MGLIIGAYIFIFMITPAKGSVIHRIFWIDEEHREKKKRKRLEKKRKKEETARKKQEELMRTGGNPNASGFYGTPHWTFRNNYNNGMYQQHPVSNGPSDNNNDNNNGVNIEMQ